MPGQVEESRAIFEWLANTDLATTLRTGRWAYAAANTAHVASIAALLLTTEALVTNFDKEDKEKQAIEGSVR